MNSGDVLEVETGSLYPALHRLEKKKWISSEWQTSENKQRVKIYKLTAIGKKQLVSQRSRWDKLLEAMAGVLNPEAVSPRNKATRDGQEMSMTDKRDRELDDE